MGKSNKSTPSKVNSDYNVVKTLSAGSNSTYTFEKAGNQSILGFDSKSEVESYIQNRENGERHFMDRK